MMIGSLDLNALVMNITTFRSLIFESYFYEVCGKDVSAIYMDNTELKVHNSIIKGCYAEFDAALGATVLL